MSNIFENMLNIEASLLWLVKYNSKKQDQFEEDALLSSEEFEGLMKISSSTAYKWREERIIAFYQIKSKIYYKMKDVNIMLRENYVPSKNTDSKNDMILIDKNLNN
ncbi:MAG: hypothetical protein ACI87N_001193 [Flavobacteriales bacterium]|jgi:hypothetical protein